MQRKYLERDVRVGDTAVISSDPNQDAVKVTRIYTENWNVKIEVTRDGKKYSFFTDEVTAIEEAD